MAVKYNKINDKKYEIVNNGQIIGVVTKNDNETVWTATSTTDKNIFAFRPTRKRATDGLIWKWKINSINQGRAGYPSRPQVAKRDWGN